MIRKYVLDAVRNGFITPEEVLHDLLSESATVHISYAEGIRLGFFGEGANVHLVEKTIDILPTKKPKQLGSGGNGE